MSKKEEILEILSEDLFYTPTPAQRRVKAAFYAAYNNSMVADLKPISPDLIAKYTGSTASKRWWVEDGFKDWFLNQNEYMQRAEMIFTRALDELEEIVEMGNDIDDPIVRRQVKMRMSQTKLTAIKLLFEITNRMPKENKAQDPLLIQRLVSDMVGKLEGPKLKELAGGSNE